MPKFGEQYTKKFQQESIRCLAQDIKFAEQCVGILQPDYFDNDMHGFAAEGIISHLTRHRELPSKVELTEYIVTQLRRRVQAKSVKQESKLILRPVEKFVKRVFNPYNGMMSEIRDGILSFCRRQDGIQTYLDACQRLETGEDPEAVFNEVLNRQKTVSAVQDTGIDFFSDIDGFFEDGKRIKARKTKTGFPKLDKFMEGGMDPGTLTVFMAPPKFGKTTILTNVGYANLIRGKKVAHISLELSARKAQRKYICRITNIPSGRLPRKQRKANKLLSRFKKRWGGQLKLKFYPTGSVHVGVLRSYLYSLRNRDGFNPDLVVVDYGDILMPTSKRKDSETDDYHGQGNVYEGLRALASELDCPVVTASQCKRAAATKVTIRMEDIADSYRKVAVADHIITLCRTEDETAKNRGRLFFAGSREAETWRWVPIRYNWKTSLIAEVHYDPEEDDEDGV